MALEAGVDVDLGARPFAELIDAIESGKIDIAKIDSAASRVLRMKFDMGLFENPYRDPKEAGREVRSKKHIAISRKAAQESIVLLENKNNVLPLSAKKVKKIAVIGPNANTPYNQLGDYTAPQERAVIRTVLDGIKGKVPAANVIFAKGTAIRDTAQSDIEAAVQAAVQAES